MNIWFIHHYAVPPGSAGGTRHFTVADRLTAAGHTVRIAASSYHYLTQRETREFGNGVEQLERIRDVEFVWIRSAPHRGNSVGRLLNMLSFAFRAFRSRILRQSGAPDVVLGSSPQPFAALAGWALARRHKARFVYEVRDLWPETLVDLGRIPRWNPVVLVFRIIQRFCLRRADAVITLLPGATAYLVSKGADPARIVWVPNGVDLDLIGPATCPPSRPYCEFVYAGAIGFANNLDVVVRAAAKLIADPRAPAVRVRLIGDGPERPGLEALAASLGASNVEFVPPVPKDEIYDLLRAADCCLMVLRDSPVFRWGISPNKLFDYLASARPVLFAVHTPDDPVTASGAGVCADPSSVDSVADAMVRLASLSAAERQVLGLKGRAYVEQHHDLKRLASRFADALIGRQSA